jgi:hypothetical protein
MSYFPLFIGSSNLIRWDKMWDPGAEDYLNDATVTFTLVDENGDNVSGAVNVAMGYVANSNGRYQGTLEGGDVDLGSPGDEFDLEITAARATSPKRGFRKIRSKAQYKGAGG